MTARTIIVTASGSDPDGRPQWIGGRGHVATQGSSASRSASLGRHLEISDRAAGQERGDWPGFEQAR